MRKFFFYLLIFLGTLIVLITLGSLIAVERLWWIKLLDFPRIQVLVLALLVLLFFTLLSRDWNAWKFTFLAGLLATILIQSVYLFPYTDWGPEKVPTVAENAVRAESTVSVLVANVKMTNRQYKVLLQLVSQVDPDMVLAIETNKWWEKALQPLDEKYPYGMAYPLDNTYGMMLYSKLPLLDEQIKFMMYDSVPSFHAKVKLPSGKLFAFHGMHPVPPYPSSPYKPERREVALLKIGKMVEESGLPTVVAGDLNDVPWARREKLFDTQGKLHCTRIGRGIYSTFNATNPIIRWPLDYVFVTSDFGLIDLQRLPDFGSDHFPFYAKLALIK